jgi:hypothetical protein
MLFLVTKRCTLAFVDKKKTFLFVVARGVAYSEERYTKNDTPKSNSKHNNNNNNNVNTHFARPKIRGDAKSTSAKNKKKRRSGHLKYLHQFPIEHCCKAFIIALGMLVTGCFSMIRWIRQKDDAANPDCFHGAFLTSVKFVHAVPLTSLRRSRFFLLPQFVPWSSTPREVLHILPCDRW